MKNIVRSVTLVTVLLCGIATASHAFAPDPGRITLAEIRDAAVRDEQRPAREVRDRRQSQRETDRDSIRE